MTFSIRNWLGRGRAHPSQPNARRLLARKLVDRGIAAESDGNSTDALQHYRSAIEADPGFAPAHLNLGIALQAAGDLPAATACYAQAIAIDPAYEAAHYNFALARLLCSQYADAETAFRRALQIRHDFPEAWVGLAGALENLGRVEEALSALETALTLRNDYVGALLNSSALLFKLARFESAAASDRRVLELEPENFVAQRRLGVCLQELGHPAEAEARFREALQLKPDYTEATTSLASLLLARGRPLDALSLLFGAVASAPADTHLRGSLVDALHGIGLKTAGAVERSVLLDLSRDDHVSLVSLEATILTLMKHDSGFRIVRECARLGQDPFAANEPAVAAFLCEPLMLSALPRMIFSDAEVERVFTHMRRFLLRRFTALGGSGGSDPAVPAEFVCGLAQQCFFSGYAYLQDDEEVANVAAVRNAIESTLRQPTVASRQIEWALAVASLYESLHTLQGGERLLEFPKAEWSDAFRPLLQAQVENQVREDELARQITSITTIDDDVSRAVRAQYEENPYPRWASVPSPAIATFEDLARRLLPGRDVRVHPRPVPVLVAGCGTGHHPIQVARAFPDCEVLAVDLSRASLAYAARMTERFGVTNVAYRQADILKLGSLDQRFPIIECCGVLHHLDDPMAGWKVLVGLLEPDGLMKIALYSQIARRGVQAARDFTATLDLPLTPDGIRRCRHAILSLPEGHPARDVLTFRDFFTLDGCRDLIMHVQEHQFTLPRIADCLDRLGLRFLEFDCPEATRVRFAEMFPDPEAASDLAAWHRFETAHPYTFKSMYTFWCLPEVTAAATEVSRGPRRIRAAAAAPPLRHLTNPHRPRRLV